MNQKSLDKDKEIINNNSQLILKDTIKTLSDKTKILNKNKDLQKKKKQPLSEEEIKEIKEPFDLFDTKGIGKIDAKELKKSLELLEIDKNNLTLKKMLEELNSLEIQKNNFITFDDFIYLMSADQNDGNTKEEIKQTFDLFADKTNPNVITFNSLKNVSKEIVENMSNKEIIDMMNGKNEITFEEFYEIIKK